MKPKFYALSCISTPTWLVMKLLYWGGGEQFSCLGKIGFIFMETVVLVQRASSLLRMLLFCFSTCVTVQISFLEFCWLPSLYCIDNLECFTMHPRLWWWYELVLFILFSNELFSEYNLLSYVTSGIPNGEFTFFQNINVVYWTSSKHGITSRCLLVCCWRSNLLRSLCVWK
jgi:hypothetical protein